MEKKPQEQGLQRSVGNGSSRAEAFVLGEQGFSVPSTCWTPQREGDPLLHSKTLSRTAMALAVIWLGLSPGTGQAGFVLFTPNPNSKDEFKLFNDEAHKNVTSFTATVGNKTPDLVDVTTVGAVDTGAGFANIKPADNSIVLKSVTFTPRDPNKFNDFATNFQLDGPKGSSQETFTLTVVDNFGATFSFTQTVKADKNNFPFDLAVIADTAGEFIKSVTLAAADGIKESKQTEFSLGASVPEPTTMVLSLTGLAGLGLTWWRKGRKTA
jgi:hypothetical protein